MDGTSSTIEARDDGGVVHRPHLLEAAEVSHAPLDRVGGKASGLGRLVATAITVPPFFCVTTDAFDLVAATVSSAITTALAGLDVRDRRALAGASEAIDRAFVDAGLGPEDETAVLSAFDRLFGEDARVSVRSSAMGEDSEKDSFAGQLDTYLFVTRSEVVKRVLECFASAFSERALLYRHVRNLPSDGVRTAVIVQEMVDARASGVLFTANPTSGDRNEMVVSAGFGLGEGVVSGTVECDTYYVNATTDSVRSRVVAKKRSRIVFDESRGAGTRTDAVAEAQSEAPVLTEDELRELSRVGRSIAEKEGRPLDIEWAIDEQGAIHVLQARPITTLASGRQTIFDNSNVVESYPGLSLPLTFSFVRLGYEVLFRESSRLFGVTDDAIEKNHDIFPNLLGLLDGRIYYNITNWYRLFLQLPGMEKAIPAWEKALGIEQRFARPTRETTWWTILVGIPTRLAVLFRLLRNWNDLPAMVERFRESCARVEEDFRTQDLRALDAHELLELSERYGRDLRPKYSVTVVNDFITQQLYEVLGRLIGRFELGDPVATRNALLCGERGMESVQPVRSIVRLAENVRGDANLRALFEGSLQPLEVWRRVEGDEDFAAFRTAARKHIDLFGDRTLEELKLETLPLGERPEQLVPMLRNYLRGGQNVEDMERHEQGIRQKAEALVLARLRWRPLRRALFSFVLRTCRWGIKTRENLRLARSRSFGILKRVYRAMGRRLAERGLLGEPDDVFFIGIEEIAALIRGSSLTRDVRALVTLRQGEYSRFRGRAIAPRIMSHGIVYATAFDRALGVYDDALSLQGIGCSPGRAKAPARVILEPQGDLTLDGEVLVAASTDPGWVFMMVAAGGLISEKGSVLSHTAIIGRELGIPTVVGVKDATTRLSDGRVVEIDGEAGTVILEPLVTADTGAKEMQP